MGLNKQHIIYNHLVRSSKIYAKMSIRVKFLEFVYVNDTSPLSPVTTIGTLSEVVTDEITSTATRSSPVEERTTTEFVYTSELVTKEPDIDRGIIELQSHNDTTSFFLNESSVYIIECPTKKPDKILYFFFSLSELNLIRCAKISHKITKDFSLYRTPMNS